MGFTKEDYYWMGGGAILAAIGGFMWWKNSQKNKDQEGITDGGGTGFENNPDQPQTPKDATPKTVGGGRQYPVKVKGGEAGFPADTFRYQKGQVVMAAGGILQTYEAKENADGSWSAKLNKDSQSIKLAGIQPGDKLGEIIWTGITANGNVRYAVKRYGNFTRNVHWIVGNSRIKPIAPNLGTVMLFANKNLNIDRILSKGMFDSPEVEELQRLLGFSKPDGDFGDITEKALVARKGVKSISLNKF